MKHIIFGVHVTQRVDNVPAVQAVLTKYGCNIRTRLGLHDADAHQLLAQRPAAHRRLWRRDRGLLSGAHARSRAWTCSAWISRTSDTARATRRALRKVLEAMTKSSESCWACWR